MSARVNIGELRERVTLEAATETPDGQGGASRVWAPLFGLWARVEPMALFDEPESGRTLRRYRVTVRFQPDLKTYPHRLRLLWREAALAVRAVSDPDVRGERLHLICEEI